VRTTPFRYLLGLAAVIALALPAAASALPSLAANPANKLLARGIDPVRYDDATRCTGHDTPGIKALEAWLAQNSAGISWGTYRCEMWGKHSASLHAEGRAIDWHLDAAVPSEKRAAYALIKLLLAPDKDGNPVALARRMGIQGLIFDCQSWWGDPSGELGDYSYCTGKNGKRKNNLDPTQAHMNHIHIELNKLGAAMKTTFWNPKVKYPIQTPDTGTGDPYGNGTPVTPGTGTPTPTGAGTTPAGPYADPYADPYGGGVPGSPAPWKK
jgi:hypothetical protein